MKQSKDKSNNHDPLGNALLDYLESGKNAFVEVNMNLGEDDNLWIKQFFRSFNEMPKIERMALEMCKGKVLDVGAGGGAHSKYLQNKGLEVHAIDTSKGAVEAMKSFGIKNAENKDFFELRDSKFDTVLMLMNGLGIVGKVDRLPEFFQKLDEILEPEGQLIFDSSDVLYMYEDELGDIELDFDKYYGEIRYQMKYNGMEGEAFHWLFMNYHSFKSHADMFNYECKLIRKESNNSYLAIATKKV